MVSHILLFCAQLIKTYTVFTEQIQEFRSKTTLWECPIDTNKTLMPLVARRIILVWELTMSLLASLSTTAASSGNLSVSGS